MLVPILLLLFYNICDAYKILVVNPKLAYSHMRFMGKIADVLVDAGHDVVTLQPVLAPYPSNGTTKSRLIQMDVDSSDIAPFITMLQKGQKEKWTDSATNPFTFSRPIPMFKKIISATVASE
ncbi:unnamed protein product [Strongylus vulgaris]|uniref:Glucuronosyltransferase n=1 Tax=Strongylus vulgaris TaxID=40348 RepID=A0A3P7I5R4_STRVU|nr:unnamed protein product [Strongylus vulgaris]